MSEEFSGLFPQNANMASEGATITSIGQDRKRRGGKKRHPHQLASTNASLARALSHSHQ